MRHEAQMRQLICFSFAKEYGLKMKRQLIIEGWWVWRFFHVRKSDDDLKDNIGIRKRGKNGLRNIQTGNDRGSEAEAL